MLRRPPTTITLTSTDLELYEANRQRKLWEKQQQQQGQSSQSSNGSTEKGKEREFIEKSRPTQKDRIMGGQSRQGN